MFKWDIDKPDGCTGVLTIATDDFELTFGFVCSAEIKSLDLTLYGGPILRKAFENHVKEWRECKLAPLFHKDDEYDDENEEHRKIVEFKKQMSTSCIKTALEVLFQHLAEKPERISEFLTGYHKYISEKYHEIGHEKKLHDIHNVLGLHRLVGSLLLRGGDNQ